MAVRVAGYNSEKHETWVNILKHVINQIKATHKKVENTNLTIGIHVYLFYTYLYYQWRNDKIY